MVHLPTFYLKQKITSNTSKNEHSKPKQRNLKLYHMLVTLQKDLFNFAQTWENTV
jgi:hypothetical protein